MNEKYLVINAGSSSLKFSLYDVTANGDEQPVEMEIVNGIVEKIGYNDSSYTLKFAGRKIKQEKCVMDHVDAVKTMLNALLENGFIEDVSEIKGVGHRILHGGEDYSDSILIDDKVLSDIKDLTRFGPLHHPGQIAGIEGMQTVLPTVPQVAVFDTAFHHTIPQANFMYAVPYEWYEKLGVRKYGFHGTSYKYITKQMQEKLGKDDVNLIICHIGSGASMCCVKNGESYDTTMGLTPLDGLVMGTRCGSIDASIVEFVSKAKGTSVSEVTSILNKNSGLLGLSGKSDWRDICALAEHKDPNGILAMNMLQNSVIRFLGQYCFELNGHVDAIVFTAGIGENSKELRANVINAVDEVLGIRLNDSENNIIAGFKDKHEGIITTPDSLIPVYVIPTDEEKMILEDTYNICKRKKSLGRTYTVGE